MGTSPRVQALDDGSKNHKENKSKILASNFACDTHKWFKRGNVETLLELHIYMIKLLTTNIESYAWLKLTLDGSYIDALFV